ncbi:MAG: hypothetical protein H6843_08055 [Rhodospirillaceae bacterium]|nr:hypothetical protein [Rhodospirillaceae bacterium]
MRRCFAAIAVAALLALAPAAASAQVAYVNGNGQVVYLGNQGVVAAPYATAPPFGNAYGYRRGHGTGVAIGNHGPAFGQPYTQGNCPPAGQWGSQWGNPWDRRGFGNGAIVVTPGQLATGRGVYAPALGTYQPTVQPHQVYTNNPVTRALGSGHPVWRFYYGD